MSWPGLLCIAGLILPMQAAAQAANALERGLKEARAGDCRTALIDLRSYLSVAPNDVAALNAIGLCESMSGHPERATKSFETIVKLQPQAWQAWNNLGANYLAVSRVEPAVGAFRKAVAYNPNAGSAWFNLASALLQQGSKLDAFRALDRAHQLDPKDEQAMGAWLNVAADIATKAGSEIDSHRYAEAYSLLLAVQKPLESSASWNNLIGYAEFKLNKTEAAQGHLEAALKKEPNNEDYLLDIGEFLAAHHAYKEAGQFFEVGAKRLPDSPRVRFGLAISEILLDRRTEATAQLEQLKSKYANWEPVYHALGECYEDAGNGSAMIQLGKALQAQKPDDAEGWYLEGAGQERLASQNGLPVASAIPSLQRAVALDPSSDRYHFELGKTYQETHDLAEAVQELKRAVELDPDHQRAHYVLARVYQELGENKLADLEFQAHSRIKKRGQQDAYVAMLTVSQRSRPDYQAKAGR